jgi:rod shape-determining protein MreC
MLKQKNYLALGAVVLAAVVLLSLPSRASSRLKLAVSSWFLPLFGLTNAAKELPVDLADAALPRRELFHQIDVLRRENDQLKLQQVQMAAITRENDQLRALLGWQRTAPWKIKLANVSMHDPANWWNTVQIDLGSRDGVQTNMPVLTPDGLVGRVSAVGFFSSQVVLIGDRNCLVSAQVDDPTHDIGVLTSPGPQGTAGTSLVDMNYLSRTASLKAGENVFTSGLGGVFPKGILIGRVLDAQAGESGLATSARVKLNVDLGALEQVGVLFK